METVLLTSRFGLNTNAFDPTSLWANPQQTLASVKIHLARFSPAQQNDRNIKLGSWNMEYMWQAKAKHFIDTYKEIVSRHHILAVQEVTHSGLANIAKACNYNFYTAEANSRGQAVGFLVHPRLHIENIYEYPQLKNVYGINDLRPALQLNLLDSQTKQLFSVLTVHLKSMLGGLKFTSCVRRKQLQHLLAAIPANNNPTIIVGDFNCLLDTVDDCDCLLKDGYSLANPYNHSSTQSKGGRLDGLFYKNLPVTWQTSHYKINNFWLDPRGKSLSDHGLLTWRL